MQLGALMVEDDYSESFGCLDHTSFNEFVVGKSSGTYPVGLIFRANGLQKKPGESGRNTTHRMHAVARGLDIVFYPSFTSTG